MGRGRHQHWYRRWADNVQRPIYGSGWISRAAYNVGLQGRVLVDHRVFPMPGDPGSRPLRVVFLSDIHAGPLTDPRVLNAAVDLAAESSPDLILLGGDYVSLDHRDVSAFAQRLAPLRSRCEIFAVLGNHDLWQDEAAIRRVLEDAGVIVLVNESRRLAAPFQRVVVYGMDEPGTGDPKPPPPPTDDSLRIVIMHSPLGVRLLAPGTFHVAFCGHTHGGQIALPSGRPLLLPIGAGDRKQAGGGVFPVNGGHLLISRGVGMSDLPVRLFAHSEIHACVFEPAST